MQLYKNKIITLEERLQKLPNGKSKKITVVKHSKVSVIIPVRNGRFVLENHYRPVIRKWILELPAGFVDKGETPRQAAIRELEEETGLKSKRLRYLFKNYSSPGFTDELAYFFLADRFEDGVRKLEDSEILNIKEISVGKALQMVKSDRINDSKTIKGILYYAAFLNKSR